MNCALRLWRDARTAMGSASNGRENQATPQSRALRRTLPRTLRCSGGRLSELNHERGLSAAESLAHTAAMSALPPRRSPRPRLQPMRTRRVHQDRLASKVADHHAGRAGRRACRLSPPHSASHGQAEHRIVITRWSRGEITDAAAQAAAQAVHARKAVARGSQCRSATKRTGGFPRVTAGLPRHPTPSNSSDRRRVMVSRAFVGCRIDLLSLKGQSNG